MSNQLTYAQRRFLESAVAGHHTPRSPTNATGNALSRRGLVNYSFATRGWIPTVEGVGLIMNGDPKKELTEADNHALKQLPDGWFRADYLPINRPLYRCERLEERNVLESRILGAYPDLWREYRKIEGGAA